MNKYPELKNQYRSIKLAVEATLLNEINNSNVQSKHILDKCLPVQIYTDNLYLTEIVYLNNRLCLLDEHGLEYNLYIDNVDLDYLINILNEL